MLKYARRITGIDLLFLVMWFSLAYLACTISLTKNPFFFLAVFGGAVLVSRFFYATVYKGLASDGDLGIAAGIPIFQILSALAAKWVISMTPHTYDQQLNWLDCGVSQAIHIWALRNYWAYLSLYCVYVCLPMAIFCVLATTSGARRRALVFGLALGGALCVPCYLLCPAVGPGNTANALAARNCMPSMHLTWALLLWVNAKGVTKKLAGVFSLLTAMATITTGEHYLLDLVVALPWTWLLVMLSGWAERIYVRHSAHGSEMPRSRCTPPD